LTETARLAQHVLLENKNLAAALDHRTLNVRTVPLAMKTNIGQRELVQPLSMEHARLVQHALLDNKNPVDALDH